MQRTKHTTEILKSYFQYEVEVVEMSNLQEQSYGEFRGMSHKEIIEKYGCKNERELCKVYRNNSEESIQDFEKRVLE
jgi:broad specificity phosphatase PhoE